MALALMAKLFMLEERLRTQDVPPLLGCSDCVFRPKPTTQSDAKRPLIPAQTGRPFRR